MFFLQFENLNSKPGREPRRRRRLPGRSPWRALPWRRHCLGSTLIRKLAGELALPLMMIFRKSMQLGVVPEQWKEANVTAIFKRKGHKSDPGNYRPVSLTSQIGKIFERLIRDRIVRFLEDNNKLRDSQQGFRAKRSCLTILLEFFDLVVDYVDQGVPVDAVYLDFQKAFDKVSHE